MPTKPRIIIVSILILLGGALFYYCAAFYPFEIAAQVKAVSTTITEPEPAPELAPEPTPVKETSIETPEQDKSEPVNQSPPERRPRPRSGAI